MKGWTMSVKQRMERNYTPVEHSKISERGEPNSSKINLPGGHLKKINEKRKPRSK